MDAGDPVSRFFGVIWHVVVRRWVACAIGALGFLEVSFMLFGL